MLPSQDSRADDRQVAYEWLLGCIAAGTARCGVMGLGFIGSVLMDALIHAGLDATGYDRATGAVERYRQQDVERTAPARRPVRIGSAPEMLANCDVIFVAVRNPVENGAVNPEPLQTAEQLLGTQRRGGTPRLIILESTVAPGSTRAFAAALGCRGDGEDCTFVVHAPERLSAGHDHTVLRALPHLVAGLDPRSVRLGTAMLEQLCDRVIPVSAPEVSELSKLLENAFLSVNIALVGEITRLSGALGIRAHEVCAAAATKPGGFMAFHPGAGVGGHCLPSDLHILADAVTAHGFRPEMLEGAIAANDRAPAVAVQRLEQLLGRQGTSIAGSSVLVVGVGFKPGSGDTARSPACDVVRILRSRAAAVSYCDHLVGGFTVDGEPVEQAAAAELAGRRFTAVMILSGDDTLSEQSMLAANSLILDAGGSRKHRGPVVGIETL